MKKEELARKTIALIIKADATEDTVREFIKRAKEYPFSGIAVDLPYLEVAKELLQGTETRIVTVAAHPLGGMTRETKIRQIKYAIEKGADEISVSLNYNAIKSGDLAAVSEEVGGIVGTAKDRIELLVTLQTHILTNEEKIEVCNVLSESGVRGIKTNSGLGWQTRPEDILIIRREFGGKFRLDVGGGIRTTQQAEEYLNLGADYIHTDAPEQVIEKAE